MALRAFVILEGSRDGPYGDTWGISGRATHATPVRRGNELFGLTCHHFHWQPLIFPQKTSFVADSHCSATPVHRFSAKE
jgi:hypothetical protein